MIHTYMSRIQLFWFSNHYQAIFYLTSITSFNSSPWLLRNSPTVTGSVLLIWLTKRSIRIEEDNTILDRLQEKDQRRTDFAVTTFWLDERISLIFVSFIISLILWNSQTHLSMRIPKPMFTKKGYVYLIQWEKRISAQNR